MCYHTAGYFRRVSVVIYLVQSLYSRQLLILGSQTGVCLEFVSWTIWGVHSDGNKGHFGTSYFVFFKEVVLS